MSDVIDQCLLTISVLFFFVYELSLPAAVCPAVIQVLPLASAICKVDCWSITLQKFVDLGGASLPL